MKILFEKYHGTGNDFIILDNLNCEYDNLSIEQIQKLCVRRFGVGADGLIKINKSESSDFEVDYFNADGTKSFCGNGARCAVAFVETLGINVANTRFTAIDGVHTASKNGDIVSLDMNPVNHIIQFDNDFILNTGSPHFVRFVDNLNNENIYNTGSQIRYSEHYRKEGINVNLVEQTGADTIKIETYERGVEDETLSCGTGATACALVLGLRNAKIGKNSIKVQLKGGDLIVAFNYNGDNIFTEIQLIGPAVFVFKGEIDV